MSGVGDPFAPQADALVSQDGAAVLLPVAITGDWTIGHDFVVLSEHDLQKGEMQFGFPAALIVLLIVFGAVVAALVPLAVAMVSIIVALGISAVVGQVFDLSFFLLNMVVAMGLALGIDYTLFIASRYREERHAGLVKADAIARILSAFPQETSLLTSHLRPESAAGKHKSPGQWRLSWAPC